MIQKLTHAPIVVGDQEKALKFYTETLGFEKRADYQQPGKPRWLTVAPKGQDLEFILVQGKFKIESHLPPEAEQEASIGRLPPTTVKETTSDSRLEE